MKPSLIALLTCTAFSSCSLFEQPTSSSSNSPEENAQVSTDLLLTSQAFQQQFKHQINELPSSTSIKSEVQPTTQISAVSSYPHGDKLNINHYAQGLMQSLMENLQYVNNTTPVAVTSFVMLDSDYNQSNLLGTQLGESLMHEIHKFGIPVIDYKATGFIRITPQGDFAFSKDYEELGSDLAARYVVGGTMVKHHQGLLVNARVIGLASKAVVASAQTFIPNHIVNSLLSSSPTSNQHSHAQDNEGTTKMMKMLPKSHKVTLVGK